MTTTASATIRALLVAAGLALSSVGHAAGGEVRELMWDDLIPPDWDPFAKLEALREAAGGEIVDGSPEADAIMREFVTAGSSAPVVGELDGEAVKIPGYVVPLDRYPDTYNGRPLQVAALANQKQYVSLYLMGVYADEVECQRACGACWSEKKPKKKKEKKSE